MMQMRLYDDKATPLSLLGVLPIKGGTYQILLPPSTAVFIRVLALDPHRIAYQSPQTVCACACVCVQ